MRTVRNTARSVQGLLIVTALGLAGVVNVAAAQSSAPDGTAPTANSADSTGLQEVVVTARRRSEDLQQVPVAVSVVSGTLADSQNLNDLQDISATVPAVDFRTGASTKDRTIFIRGIGTISTSPGVEPSVSMVVDGVVYARPGMATLDLLDIDHIEVLQGPQGTLFGKNASAGVVNVVTQNPTDAFHAYAETSAFQGDEYRLKAGLSGALVPGELDALISGFTSYYRGNVLDLRDDDYVNGYSHTGGRAKLVGTPSDGVKLTFSADFTTSTDTTPTGVYSSASQTAYPSGVVTTNANLLNLLTSTGISPTSDNKLIDQGFPTSVLDQNGGVSLQGDFDLPGDYTLTSITAWRDWNNVQYQDYSELSGVTPNFAQGDDVGHVNFNQQSEEVRVASPRGKLIDYVAGLYFLRAADNETYSRTDYTLTGGIPATSMGIAEYGTLDKNFAPFGEGDVNFTSRFRAIIGFREIWDWLSYYHSRQSVIVGAPPGIAGDVVNGPSSVERVGFADRFGLQYDLTRQIMGYFTYSRGYMGPAYDVFFNMAAVNRPPLAPETSNNFELGVKGDLFDNRLQANLGAFNTLFHDYQANFEQAINGGLVSNLINAGSVSTKGLEADLTARATQALTVTFNALYDDAKVDNFPCPAGSPASCYINGEPLPFAPRWKLHDQEDYLLPLDADSNLDLETDYNYQSWVQYQLTETANTIQPGYGIWNASVGWLGTSNGWQARVLVKNILDKHYSSYLSAGTFAGTVRWVPRDDDRYFGVTLRKDF